MKNITKENWLPFAGSASSISMQGVTDILNGNTIIDTTNSAIQNISAAPVESLLRYFWIGALGALGGLIVKIIWGLLKKKFKFLKDLDNGK